MQAKFPEGLGFVSGRRGKNAIESLWEYTSDSRYLILFKMEGITPVDWVIFDFLEGELLADGEFTLTFRSLYEAKGHLIKLYSEREANGQDHH